MPPLDALICSTTTRTTGPVEWVLEEDHNDEGDPCPCAISTVLSDQRRNDPRQGIHLLDYGASLACGNGLARQRRVSISEDDNVVHEIPTHPSVTTQCLWYTDQEYHQFFREARCVGGGGGKPKRHRGDPKYASNTPTPLCSPWIVRGLWLGSIVMGILATSLDRQHSKTSSR